MSVMVPRLAPPQADAAGATARTRERDRSVAMILFI
jgi:hypothetical protein